jgi:hypothetical protein
MMMRVFLIYYDIYWYGLKCCIGLIWFLKFMMIILSFLSSCILLSTIVYYILYLFNYIYIYLYNY